MFTRTLTRVAVIFLGFAFGQVQWRLEENSPFMFPLDNRFEPDPISMRDSLACLYYNINRTVVATADFDRDVVFIQEKISGGSVYAPRAVPFGDYFGSLQWELWQSKMSESFQERARRGTRIEIPMELPPAVRGIVGVGGAGLSVNGRYKITMAGRSEWSDQEVYYGSKWPQLQMEQESNFTITGTIGSKVAVKIDQDSRRATDLENTINIKYTGEEDDVVQSIEAGNTTLSLPGGSLLGYTERVQGLFGIKSILQVGDWNITAIASQEKSNTQRKKFTPGLDRSTIRKADWEYKRYTYYYLDDVYAQRVFSISDTIVDFKLYKRVNTPTGAIFGYAIARNISNVGELPATLVESDTVKSGYYVEISPGLYDIDRVGGWIRLANPASRDDVLGVRYVVKRGSGTRDTVGFCANDSCDTIYLRLIKPDDLQPNHPCWEYEWRNVYDLEGEDLDISRVEIRLFYKVVVDGRQDSSEVMPGTTDYFLLKLFNMDSINLSGEPISDGIVDQTPVFIDPARGELIFPVPHPFDPQPIDIALRPGLSGFPDSLRNPGIYTSTNQALWQQYSDCFLSIKREAFSTVQNLGDYNIIENSEIVTANGVRLKKGEDYIIDYTIGQIKFISDRARDPNAKIEIEYESRPFFSAEQKTLLGARAQYELWENSWLGFVGLYKNMASPDRRPRVGQEPSRAFGAGADLKLRFDMPFLTSAVDAIPLVQTDRPSSSEITLEIAKVFSNPNTVGMAYIDDFESSKETDRISINRPRWTLSSPPEGYEDQPRAKVIWYNPYDRVNVTEIWPNRQVQAAQSKVDVLTLEFIDTTSTPGDSMPWAGVMQYIQPGFQNQQYTQFLEVWVLGDEGVLNIDLGTISEDINNDGFLQTEDRLPYDNVLSQEEDVGLDGLPSSQEPGYDPITNPDPSGDDYYYDPATHDYSRINGTEGNRNDPAGYRNRPDSEDLNGNGVLERTNNYFTYEIDLSSRHFEVPGTRSPAGWRLYRIPLRQEYFRFVEDGKVWRRKSINNPDTSFLSIKFIRLWLTGVQTNRGKVSIAEISLVRNQWLETFDHFEVAAKNSQEDLDYVIPPDVIVEVDPTTNIPREEKSLVLKYDNLPPLDTVWAFKNLPGTREEDYTFYNKLSLWVNYDSSRCEGSSPVFFFRMGDRTRANYYEFRSVPLDQIPAYPSDNTGSWRKIIIDFAELTNFKDEYLKSIADSIAENDIPPIRATRDGSGYLRIYGAPSLTRISRFEMGIINPDHNFPISGEIWCDELVLEDVRKEPGVAKKGELKIQMADFADFITSALEQDENFHNLNQSRGSGNWSRNQNYTLNLSLHKFFPLVWGVNLPLSLTYTDGKTVPRFRTGTDIVLDQSRRDAEKTVTYSRGISLAGVGVAPQNPGWAMALFVMPNRLSYSTNRTITHSPVYPDELARTTIIRHTYNWAPKELIGFGFGKADTSASGKARKERVISVIPSKVDITNEINDGFNYRRNAFGTSIENHARTLQHTTSLQYKPVEEVSTNFSVSVARDIKDPSTIRLGFPTIIGIGLRKTINDGLTFSPKWVDFLTQQYSFTSQYSENTDPVTRRNLAGFGSVSQTRNIGVNMTLMLKKLFKAQSSATGGKSKIVNMFDDVRSDYRWTANQERGRLERRPGRFFQLGLTGNPGVSNAVESGQQTTTQSDSRRYTDDLSLSSGVMLPYEIKADTRFRYTLNREYRTTYIRKSERTFPDISVRWGFVKNLKFFKSFTRSVSANSGWKYKTSKEYAGDILSKRTFENNFSPFLSMNFSLKNGVNIDIAHNRQSTLTEQYTQARTDYNLNKQNETSVVVRYTVRAQKGIKIPLLGSITFENNLNLSLNVTRTGTKTESWKSNDTQRSRLRDNTVWSIKPQATYELSRNAVAGIQIEIREDTNNILDITRHLREVRIWVQFEFGGGTTIGGTPSPGYPGTR